MEQIERIRQMERQLDRASLAVKKLEKTLRQYEQVQEDIQVLSNYYGSEEWKLDFTADEADLLPQNLKRGVLSEDAVWNLLEENRELKTRMAKMVKNMGIQ